MALDWQPLRELEGMKKEMERIWDEVFPAVRRSVEPSRRVAAEKGAATPAIDISDKVDSVVITVEMPGVPKEAVEISFQDNTLSIRGEIEGDKEPAEKHYTYSERDYRYYTRRLNVPFKIAQDKITAALKNGILTVTLPKAIETQPQKIKVEVS